MPRAYLKKYPNGMFMVEDDDGNDVAPKLKIGDVLQVDWKQVRNYKRLQAIHALFRIVYDYFCEHPPELGSLTYKGHNVLPSYDRFRRDLVILAGHYDATYNIKGQVRLEAKSLAYGNCSQDEFEKIFSDVITAALTFVYKNTRTEGSLRQQLAEQIAEFATH